MSRGVLSWYEFVNEGGFALGDREFYAVFATLD